MKSVRITDVAKCAAWVAAFVASSAFAGPGDLDAGFGTNGIARHVLPGYEIYPSNGVIQRDGKIVVVGTVDPTQNVPIDENWIVVRLNPDGSLDTSFSGDGIAIVDFGGSDSAGAVLITSDDKILIAGRTFSPAPSASATLARLNADGSLDTTFGVGGIARYLTFRDMGITAIAELSDGRFVLGGHVEGLDADFGLFAVRSNGALDTTFGTAARQVVDFDGADDYIVGLRRLPGDRVVAVGTTNDNGNQSIGVVLINSAGQLDTSLGAGVASYNLDSWHGVNDIELQADGKLLIAGSYLGNGGFPPMGMVLRLNPDGTIDRSFGSQGRVLRADEVRQVATDANGRIYFAGDSLAAVNPPYGRSRGFVEAVERDGAPSKTFAGSGGTTIDIGRDGRVSDLSTYALLRQTDGRLVVVGESVSNELVAVGIAASGEHAGIISVAQGSMPASDTPYTLSESQPNVSFTVERTGGSQGSVSVSYVAESATAVAGQDFVATSGTLTWGDGETAAKIVTVPLIDDTDYESNESFALRISNPTGGASLGTATSSAVVTSDERTTQVDIYAGRVMENAGTMRVIALRGGDARTPAIVQYSVAADSGSYAQPNVDFTPVSGTLTWAPFDLQPKFIDIPILDDGIQESGEDLRIQLNTTAPGVIAYSSALGTIVDDDGSNPGTVNDLSVYLPENAGTLTITVNRPGGTGAPITANLSINDPVGSNLPGPDHGALDFTQLTWAANDTTPRTVTIPIIDDAVAEGHEQFVVVMDALPYSSNNAIKVFTILDDDADLPGPGQLSFAQSAMNVSENGGSVTVTLNRLGAAAFYAEAELTVSGLAPSSYTLTGSTTLRWAGGDNTPRTFVINMIDNAIAEPPRTLTIGLRNLGGGVSVGPIASTRINVADDDGFSATAGFTQDEIVISEDAEYVDLPYAATGAPGAAGAALTFAVRNGGTADAGREYVVERRVASWSVPQSYPLAFRIYLNGDMQYEDDETFTVDLVKTGGSLPVGRRSVTVRLVSDDSSQPPTPMQVGFVTTQFSQREDQTLVNVAVRRTGASDRAVSVRYETVAGSASAETDFVAATGELQWAVGDTADKTIALMLTNDTAVESTETMTVRLFAPTNGATLDAATATITITDDDTTSSPPSNNGGSSGGGGGGPLDSSVLFALLVLVALRASACIKGWNRYSI